MSRINTMSGGFTGYTSITAPSKEEPEYINSVVAFAQATAPVGWIKQTAYNDYAIRVVSGSTTTGGSRGFASVFTTHIPFPPVSGSWPMTVGTTTLSTTQMIIHSHTGVGPGAAGGTLRGGTPSPAPYWTAPYSTSGSVQSTNTASEGLGGGHSHSASVSSISLTSSLPLNVKYLDVILAKY